MSMLQVSILRFMYNSEDVEVGLDCVWASLAPDSMGADKNLCWCLLQVLSGLFWWALWWTVHEDSKEEWCGRLLKDCVGCGSCPALQHQLCCCTYHCDSAVSIMLFSVCLAQEQDLCPIGAKYAWLFWITCVWKTSRSTSSYSGLHVS